MRHASVVPLVPMRHASKFRGTQEQSSVVPMLQASGVPLVTTASMFRCARGMLFPLARRIQH
eukprot:4932230-Alexandrium_andersonii.AAC.1